MNLSNVGDFAFRSNSTGAILVIRSFGSCGFSEPVLRSSVPFSTLRRYGSVSSSSGVIDRSAFASVHMALRRSKLCERMAHSAISTA